MSHNNHQLLLSSSSVLLFLVSVVLALLLSAALCHAAGGVFKTLDEAEKMQSAMQEAERQEREAMKQARGGTINEEHVWMDGLADAVEMNCPSLKYKKSMHFNPTKKQITTSVRCATCNLMKEFMVRRARLLVLKGRKPSVAYVLEGDDDGTKSSVNNFASKEFCEAVHEFYHLREQPDGERVWARRISEEEQELRSKMSPEELKKNALLSDRDRLMKTHLVSSSGEPPEESELLPVKFHTPHERRTLPCARYFLKQMCFAELEAREEPIDNCFDAIISNMDKLNKKEKNEDAWIEALDQCLGNALACEKKFCKSQLLAKIKKQEWIQFAWYEGAFGNQKFSYIPDFEQKGRNMLNPYRKKGDKANENPWLNGTWTQVEDLSRIADEDQDL